MIDRAAEQPGMTQQRMHISTNTHACLSEDGYSGVSDS